MKIHSPLFQSQLSHLKLIGRGKVRDLYAIDNDYLLIVTTDRLSAFDVVLSQPIPAKGAILTQLSNFWFRRTQNIIANHLTNLPLASAISNPSEYEILKERTIIVKRVTPLPIEAVVRGYLIGSGWKDYQQTGHLCGIALPPNLRLAQRLDTPIFTPSTKASLGSHDENIDFAHVATLIGKETAQQIRTISLAIYQQCAAFAATHGIIIADTKLEFGYDQAGNLILIDELLTPDSSRFWPSDQYTPGTNPPSFDKQFVRDYLETLGWNKTPPSPILPQIVIEKTTEKYLEAAQRLIGNII